MPAPATRRLDQREREKTRVDSLVSHASRSKRLEVGREDSAGCARFVSLSTSSAPHRVVAYRDPSRRRWPPGSSPLQLDAGVASSSNRPVDGVGPRENPDETSSRHQDDRADHDPDEPEGGNAAEQTQQNDEPVG